MDVGAGTGVGGGHQSDLEPEGDDRESVLAVGRELKHFGRKRIDTCGEIFIVLKHINTSSNWELLLIGIISNDPLIY
jgi:hypothetical protein